jgi:hypothetical protein
MGVDEMKSKIIPRDGGGFLINMPNYGYLLFDPLQRTCDTQYFSARLKIMQAMSMSGLEILAVTDQKTMFKQKIIIAIRSMRDSLDNLEKELESL